MINLIAWALVEKKTKKIKFDWLYKTKQKAIDDEGFADEGRFEIKKVKITYV